MRFSHTFPVLVLASLLALPAARAGTPCRSSAAAELVAELELATSQPLHPLDASIRRSLELEAQGRYAEAVELMRHEVWRTDYRSAKARYFLARAYRLARQHKVSLGKRDLGELELLHLRAARKLSKDGSFADNAQWAEQAEKRLRERALRAPILNQHEEGGEHPGGYCAITTLRMVLHLEGLKDPGPDEVADGVYTPGEGSSGSALADRARELGLPNARFTRSGTAAQVRESLDQGRPVMAGGEGRFVGKDGDYTWDHTYAGSGHWMLVVGYEEDASGKVTRWIVNDPDTGRRYRVEPDDFEDFFNAGEGDGHIWMVTYGK